MIGCWAKKWLHRYFLKKRVATCFTQARDVLPHFSLDNVICRAGNPCGGCFIWNFCWQAFRFCASDNYCYGVFLSDRDSIDNPQYSWG